MNADRPCKTQIFTHEHNELLPFLTWYAAHKPNNQLHLLLF